MSAQVAASTEEGFLTGALVEAKVPSRRQHASNHGQGPSGARGRRPEFRTRACMAIGNLYEIRARLNPAAWGFGRPASFRSRSRETGIDLVCSPSTTSRNCPNRLSLRCASAQFRSLGLRFRLGFAVGRMGLESLPSSETMEMGTEGSRFDALTGKLTPTSTSHHWRLTPGTSSSGSRRRAAG